jgi:hypothetical protein
MTVMLEDDNAPVFCTSRKYEAHVSLCCARQIINNNNKYIALIFFLKRTMRKNLCEKCCVGTLFKAVNAEKRQFGKRWMQK